MDRYIVHSVSHLDQEYCVSSGRSSTGHVCIQLSSQIPLVVLVHAPFPSLSHMAESRLPGKIDYLSLYLQTHPIPFEPCLANHLLDCTLLAQGLVSISAFVPVKERSGVSLVS